jgi:tRNA pseudouridine38-40 synthase
MKIALKLAYLGNNYHGFQRQPGLRTVDFEIRKALEGIGVLNGDFCYAGRTDRGVSALGQVIDFWIDEEKRELASPRVINSRLPRDIWAWAWAVAPVGFSARWSALWREYRYLLYSEGLDLDIMRCASKKLLGEHDFRNFSSSKRETVREILRLEVGEREGLVLLDVRANGFLWNMVRKIVLALEEVGSGRRDPSWIDELLDPEINRGVASAPPEGLILMDVGYPDLEWQLDERSMRRAAGALSSTVRRQISSAYAARAIQEAMEG